MNNVYSKTCVKRPLSKRPKIGFQDQLSLNAGQKYCRMLQGEHSAILLTFIKLPFVIEIIVLSIFEWSFYTGFSEMPTIPIFSGIIPFFKADFRITISDVKITILQAKMVPDKIKDVTLTYTPVLRTFYVAVDNYT